MLHPKGSKDTKQIYCGACSRSSSSNSSGSSNSSNIIPSIPRIVGFRLTQPRPHPKRQDKQRKVKLEVIPPISALLQAPQLPTLRIEYFSLNPPVQSTLTLLYIIYYLMTCGVWMTNNTAMSTATEVGRLDLGVYNRCSLRCRGRRGQLQSSKIVILPVV